MEVFTQCKTSEYFIQGKKPTESQNFSVFSVTEVSIATEQLLCFFSALLSILKIFKNREPGIE